MKNAVIFLADGTESCEALITADLLQRAGIHVTTASVMGRREVLAAPKARITADCTAEQADYDRADVLVLPGGIPGVDHIRANGTAMAQVRRFADEGRLLAAICAAPGILSDLGLLADKCATVHPGCAEGFHAKRISGEKAVTDGAIITGQALGGAFAFALAIIRALLGEEAAAATKKQICL